MSKNDVALEERRKWLQSLSQKDRDFIGKWGLENYQKFKEQEKRERTSQKREQKQVEETERLKQTEIPQKFLKALEETLSENETLKITLEEIINEKGEMQLLIEQLYERIEGLEAQLGERDALIENAEKIVAWFEKKGIKIEDLD
ncbi:hypothetical protein HXY33_05515 [Candidatus Bathyarchaeota archaeon]|nr:hypothetical protein [Candidatus Bathyarchaeota archaeon]